MTKLDIDEIIASENLPSIPEVAHRVLVLARDSTTDVADLAAALKADPAICSKVLHTANSAYFGRQFKVNSVQAAIPVLGSTLLRTLVLGFSLARQEKWQQCEEGYRKVWQRAIYQAVSAKHLSEHLAGADPNFYFACGLVQEIGSLALLNSMAEDYSELLQAFDMHGLEAAELALAGYSHIDVSVELCKKWQLAPEAIAAVRTHHDPLCSLRSQRHQTSELTEALKLASHCAHYIETGSQQFSQAFLSSLSRVFHVNAFQTTEFLQRIRIRANELTAQFDSSRDNLPDLEQIVANAKIALEEVAIQIHKDASETKCQNNQLLQEMERDPLTGVGNRRALSSQLSETIREAITRQQPVGILFFDIDEFKPHNDTFGHDAGDEALKTFVTVVRSCLRQTDLIVRYGGDEFIAVCSGPSFIQLTTIAERIRVEFASEFAASETTSLTTSVGGVHCPIESLADWDLTAAIIEADRNMYRSKKQGGNRWTIETVCVH